MDVSRRGFLAGAVAMAAGAAAGTALASEQAEDIAWDEEYDLVVVGAGIGGLAAAADAIQEGNGATVPLADKGEALPGGCSPYSACSCVYTDDVEGYKTYMTALCGGFQNTPEDVIDAFANGAAENLDWLIALGANEDEMADIAPGEVFMSSMCPEYPEPPGSSACGMLRLGKGSYLDKEVSGPTSLYQLLNEYVDAAPEQVTRSMGMAATSLVQDAGGAVVGVVFERGGETVRVKADKGVIMACGGFEDNEQMLEDIYGLKGHYSVGARLNTGDGIKMCAAIGADMWHMAAIGGTWYCVVPQDEDGDDLGNYTLSFNAKKIDVGLDGRRSDAIEELAELAGIVPEALAQTVEDWNAMCDAGRDFAFFRDPESMVKIETAPFYAVRERPVFLNTDGGPRRNAKGQVMHVSGEPIPGLYSTGDFGSVHSTMYQGGTNVSECLIFSRIDVRGALGIA